MEYRPKEIIGHGSFGIIRKVVAKDGTVNVRKEISYKSMNQKERAQLISEFRILKSLVHPNIVRYLHHEHDVTNQEVHLYMEYCGGGDLSGVIRNLRDKDEFYPEYKVWNVLTQLCLALYTCHNNKAPPALAASILAPSSDAIESPHSFVLHRDIKPENIFLDSSNNYVNVKLGDFGLAKMLDLEHPLATTYVGTPFYMSPEILTDQPSTPASDIWSLGCVMYELCSRYPPFQAKTHLQLANKVREAKFKPLPSIYSATLARTIEACLRIDPNQRPTAATLLRLDIIKICRKEIELKEREMELQKKFLLLREREEELDGVYEKLQSELHGVIEEEVERRLQERQKSINPPPLARKLMNQKLR
ncbi:serine/threonine protein kinase [Starmerella bacillaris]|uniref:non-specific serine/threonine protein kinase n=1 Tax=Starmerella bacillaris TaxID=1247836 RepID=A0AAV5RLC8_STABA|nr:serine/threonine protein kinase [Starmerella bacillaris]